MVYPPEFVEAVEKTYPNWLILHAALAEGDKIVGQYLYDASQARGITPERVIELIDSSQTDRLREEAQFQIHRWKLFCWWIQIKRR